VTGRSTVSWATSSGRSRLRKSAAEGSRRVGPSHICRALPLARYPTGSGSEPDLINCSLGIVFGRTLR
jgi:hypothetical protein